MGSQEGSFQRKSPSWNARHGHLTSSHGPPQYLGHGFPVHSSGCLLHRSPTPISLRQSLSQLIVPLREGTVTAPSPCLFQHQQQVLGAIERAKQVTAPELNSIIRVSRSTWVSRGGLRWADGPDSQVTGDGG